MIRYGDLSDRTRRMVERMNEVASVLPEERVRREQGEDPLGFDLHYPVMVISYDVNTGVEVPLSGLIYEDDPNLLVVSLIAESIAQETVEALADDVHLDITRRQCLVPVEMTTMEAAAAIDARYPAEIVTIMEVWKS